VFDLINGLPIHPLVVHAVVVLLPLACLGTLGIALRPAWRTKYGVLVVACAAAATALIPVATSSGEALQSRVGSAGEHAEMGDQLIWFAIPMLALSIALVWMDRRQQAEARAEPDPVTTTPATTPATTSATTSAAAKPSGATRAVAALAVVAALATSVQVYRVGDSGARAAWGDRIQSSR
jgi:hypothetical protein